MNAIFFYIYNFFSKHRLIFWVTLTFTFLPILFLASRLKLEEDITKILPENNNYKEYNQLLNNSKIMEKLVLRVALKDTTTDPNRLTAYAAAFVNELQGRKSLSPLIREIKCRLPEDMLFKAYNVFYNNLPFFLEQQDYKTIDSLITEKGISQNLEKDYHILISPMSMVIKEQIKQDPLHFTPLILQKLQSLQLNKNYELYDNYIVSLDHKALLIIITPSNPPNESFLNGKLIDGIDEIEKKLSSKGYADINLEYFGAAAVSVANARQIQQDIYVTVSIAVLSICFLLWGYFRKASIPIVILLPIAFGIAFALAIIYLYKQTISAVALGAGGIIIGIAVNYSLHIFVHYKHTRSTYKVIKELSVPLLIGSISTIGAFFSLLFVNSEILVDFGLFSGLSLIGTIVFSLIFLPQFLSYYTFKNDHEDKPLLGSKTINLFFHPYYKLIPLLILIISAVLLLTYKNVGFDNDLNAIAYMPAKLKKAEQNLNIENNEAKRMIYLFFKGKDSNEALSKNENALSKINHLLKEHKIFRYVGVTPFLTSDSVAEVRKLLWYNYWTPEKKMALKTTITRLATTHGFKATAFDDFFILLDKDFTTLPAGQAKILEDYFFNEYISVNEGTTVITASLEVPANQSDIVYETLSHQPGLFIFDKQYLIKKLVSIIKADFSQILYTSSLLVFLILLLFYGRIELALITFIPMLISWLWILAFMELFDIQFNIVNIIISTFIFGLGDDYSIFTMDGLLMEYKNGTKNLSSYRVAIFLSAITTLLGMGVLIVAKHPALKSIALISVVGIVCVLFISYTVIPLLFRILISNRVKRGLVPLTFSSFCWSLVGYVLFVSGSVGLIILGFLIFKVLRLNGKQVRLFYHKTIVYVVRYSIYSIFSVKKNYVNTTSENLSAPSIIVLNHQSWLDILLVLAAHPKIILFTKDWVWNSPFLGPVARMAGFFNISSGIENSLEVVRDRVKEGYSIAIFPEGSRSENGQIRRFHKGAFLLAQQLQLDILPILMHGTGYCLHKNDIFLNKGIVTIKILPRVHPDNTTDAGCYQELAKAVCKLMREEYKNINSNNFNFIYQQLSHKYIYKGPSLEWQARLIAKHYKTHKLIHNILPLNGRIYEAGCGYGFLTYILALSAPERVVTGVDEDEEKIKIANHSKLDTKNSFFQYSGSFAFEYPNADAIIISRTKADSNAIKQLALVKHFLEQLNPDGVLVILNECRSKSSILQKIIDNLTGAKSSSSPWEAAFSYTEMEGLLNYYNAQVKQIKPEDLIYDNIYVVHKHAINGN